MGEGEVGARVDDGEVESGLTLKLGLGSKGDAREDQETRDGS